MIGQRMAILAFGLLALDAGATGSRAAEEHVRGDVEGVNSDTVQVRRSDGTLVKLRVPRDVPVARVERSNLDAIRQGAFVGTTTVPDHDGALRAIEVHIFPESMRGVGEGSRPWDLEPGSSMTNAMVASTSGDRAASTMTNATVGALSESSAGRRLDLTYPGARTTVVVPAGTTIVKLEPADRSVLTTGKHIFAVATRQQDGSLLAKRITVGEGDVRPPM